MKTKVLLVYNKVWPYRIKIFELLNEKIDLTVGFSDPAFIGRDYSFKTIYLPVKKMGPFELHKDNLNKICSQYDAVVGLFNVRWLTLMLLSINPFRKYSLCYWGIGVRASYENKFDADSRWDKIRIFLAKKVESMIFYSSYPIKKYTGAGIDPAKLFVANNTIEVMPVSNIDYKIKENFLFVGTLYPQKGIDQLLDSYFALTTKNKNCPKLDIIGDGPERQRIKEFIIRNSLEDKITMYGSIYDPIILSQHYKNAIACISPNQAGLSVLTSMGNATIFVTEKEAITGGEIFNIKNNANGIIYAGGIKELTDKMEWIIGNHDESIKMCQQAFNFYNEYRKPEMMADSILDAILFSYSSFKKRI